MTSSEGLPLPAAGVSCLRPVCELFFFFLLLLRLDAGASGQAGGHGRSAVQGSSVGGSCSPRIRLRLSRGWGLRAGGGGTDPISVCLPCCWLQAACQLGLPPQPPTPPHTHTQPQSVMGGWFAGRGGSAPQPPASSALHWGIIVIES